MFLVKLDYFHEDENLAKLNEFVSRHTRLMPHELVGATGCDYDEALAVLLILFYSNVAELFLQIYHNDHSNLLIDSRKISDGFPILPYRCSACDKEISNPDELSYDFAFKVTTQVEFVTQS